MIIRVVEKRGEFTQPTKNDIGCLTRTPVVNLPTFSKLLCFSMSFYSPILLNFSALLTPTDARAECSERRSTLMRTLFCIFVCALISASSAAAELSRSATEFMKEIGVDPASEKVRSLLNDVVQTRNGEIASVEEFASKRNKAALLRFISTRNFVQAYVRDGNTRLPATEDYEPLFLTKEEKAFVQPAFRKAGDELYLRSLQQKKN
jgi:hypothetical protein